MIGTMKKYVVLVCICTVLTSCRKNPEGITATTPPPPQGRVAEVAEKISAGAGTVKIAANGSSDRTVIVFEETHTSLLGQLEIAQMLVRLHDAHGLRRVSLEGAVFEDGVLPAKWFHGVATSDAVVYARREAAVRLLKEGEINAAEFIALTLPDVQVRGNEDAAEYAVHLSDAGASASGEYLLGIAQQSLTQDQIRAVNDLIRDDRQKEALDLILNADPWVRGRFEKLTNRRGIVSAEEMAVLMRELETKANAVDAPVTDEARNGLRESIRFFEMASQRSKTMVERTLAIAGETPNVPVGMLIGAAHTARVAELLKQAGASYAVITPSSIGTDTPGELSMSDYDRKNARQSIDAAGMLGAFLDGRRKPPPNLDRQWLHSKSEIYLATVLLAGAAAGGDQPPFGSVSKELSALSSIRIDPASYEVLGDDDRKRVIFKVTARLDEKDPSRTTEIWVGGWNNEPPRRPPGPDIPVAPTPEDPRRPLEALIQDAREELTRKQKANEGKAVLLEISKRTTAAFAKSQEELKEILRTTG